MARDWPVVRPKDAYSAQGKTLCEAIQANPGYQGIKAPRNLRHRYVFEDVPCSLVPLASLGAQFGVGTWAIEAMVRLACVTLGTNFCARGRTAEDMGLKGLGVNEVMRYVQEGLVNPVYTLSGEPGHRSVQKPPTPVGSPRTQR